MPGAVVGRVSATTACHFGLPTSCEVVAGTTDSIAAFIAANATTAGHAVTSLGSTLAVKMLSEVGCAVLRCAVRVQPVDSLFYPAVLCFCGYRRLLLFASRSRHCSQF